MMEDGELQAWVGRCETVLDTAEPGPLRRLAALLDHESPPWTPGQAPPLAHWLYFLPVARQSELDVDGHPKRGGLLPPVPLPRRMWAGSRLNFLRPIPLGRELSRRSEVVDVRRKSGSSGTMVFVTVRHEVSSAGEALVVEEQDIVYREAPRPRAEGTAPLPAPQCPTARVRRHVADEVQLFRFSALTFNAHRIHYDGRYATQAEAYPGLVVQGPYLATLMMDQFLQTRPGAAIRSFSFRARAPVFAGERFGLNLAERGSGAALWVSDARGGLAMQAELDCA